MSLSFLRVSKLSPLKLVFEELELEVLTLCPESTYRVFSTTRFSQLDSNSVLSIDNDLLQAQRCG